MTEQGKQPVKVFRAGNVRAATWANETVVDGQTVIRYCTKTEKRYRNRETGEWCSTDQYFPEDLPKLQLVTAKTFEYVTLKESEETSGDSSE